MGDNDRIALMQMVKEGKISTETALQVVSSHLFSIFSPTVGPYCSHASVSHYSKLCQLFLF